MKRIHGLSFENIRRRGRHSIPFVIEAKLHLYGLVLFLLGIEMVGLFRTPIDETAKGDFVLFSLGFFFAFALLEEALRWLVRPRVATVLSILPGALVFVLLWRSGGWSLATMAVLCAAGVRLLFACIPKQAQLLLYGCFVADAVAIVLWVWQHAFMDGHWASKGLFLCLVVLTFASLQQLIFEKNQGAYPFHYFILLGILLCFLPVKEKPIDWSPVGRFANRVAVACEDVAYRWKSTFDQESYETGYGSFDVKGAKVTESHQEEVILSTMEEPYHLFTVAATGERRKSQRVIYLAGGKGVDEAQLVQMLAFLYAHGVDREQASLFSKVSRMDMEYAYLATQDEIAPWNVLTLKSGTEKVTQGVSEEMHHKGYRLQAVYLDVDYGSPYWVALCQNAEKKEREDQLSYEDACAYMDELYGMDLTQILSKETYTACLENPSVSQEYLDVGNPTERMKELAQSITQEANTEYDKCKCIENYLRQYVYNTDAVGGYREDSTMATAAGMADIADRFLFDTKEGYCVHYTSSMVMLLRCAGIPARAVQGYRYIFPFDQQSSYAVTGNYAHVWPEAYIEGAGWVPFEPTTSYGTAASYTWHRTAAGDEAIAAEFLPQNQSWFDVPTLEKEELPQKHHTMDKDHLLRILGMAAAGILVLFFVILLGNLLLQKLRYRLASPGRKVQMDVEHIRERLQKLSPEGFLDRGLLKDYVEIAPVEFRRDMDHIVMLYYQICYDEGADAVTPEESTYVRLVRDKLMHYRPEKKKAHS